ncbi:g6388 [Coccomyxa viridis]|uniref:G6388 protein n=1 Tax=Coccomyxa viridis TaxID=1274662 RepID=A0ABP1G1V3_9CHLO
MPGGVFWLDKASHSSDVVYGENFVLQRPRRGGPGLVLSPKLQAMEVAQQLNAQCTAPAALQRQPRSVSMPTIFGAGLDFLDITDYIFLDDDVETEGADLSGRPPEGLSPDCTGIVLHSSSPSLNPSASPEDEDDVVRPASGNPRRTKRIQFTCNMCGSTTTKMVNPHAWEKGTVFAQCSGCGVKHKLIDNLKLFHELRGPVFSGPVIRPEDMPAGLPAKPLINFHQHPGLFDMFNADE